MKRLFICLFTALLLAANIAAQSNSGRIIGTVSDPTGLIPGATVVITDNQTRRERTVITSDDGTFTVAQLEFGTYTVRVTSAGRKAFVAREVKIDAGREYSLKVELEVGDVSAEVTVTAGADIVNSANAELSNTVSPRQIQDLPLNGRNPLSLITLQAGTAANGSQETSINGQRPSAPNITLDGLNIQDNFIRANASSFTQITTSTDDVSEFTVTTQNAGAEQGNGPAQVQLVTPRGQSDFHGSLYTYNRNSEFAANDFFANASGTAKGFRNFNQFGGRISGPIPFLNFGEGGPVVLKDRTYFFFNYEGVRDILPAPTIRLVLTDPARQGLFTYTDNGGIRRTVNLFSIPITTGTNAPAGISPLIQSRFLANIPRGNSTVVGDQLNTTGYSFTQGSTENTNRVKARFDYDINDTNTFNLVFLRSKGKGLVADFADLNGYSATPVAGFSTNDSFIVGAYRMTPTASLSNEVRIGYTESFPSFPRTDPNPANFFQTVNTGVLGLGVNNPETTFLFQGRNTKTYTFQDNADYTRGNHSFRFGAQYNIYRALRLNDGGVLPTYTLGVNTNTPQIATAQFTNAALFPGGIGTTARNQANALYSFLGGIVTTQAQRFNVTSSTSGFVPLAGLAQDYAYENLGMYVADQWRLRPNLTVNLGLRYELWFPVRERNGVIAEVAVPAGTDPIAALRDPNGSIQIVGGNAGKGRLFNMDKNNFAPNISAAYSPDFKGGFLSALFPGNGKTVIRGGFRISYFNDEFLKGPSGEGDQNPGLTLTSTRTNLNERADNPGSIVTPAVIVPRTFADLRANVSLQQSLITVDPNIQVPSNYEYNVSLQRELGWNMALEVRYVGAFSNNATRQTNANQIDIVNNGFLADYLRAQNNCRIQGASINPTAPNPLLACTNAGNSGLAGQQNLPVFANLGVLSGTNGGLTNATVLAQIQGGTPGQLAVTYIANGLDGTVPFRANRNLLLTGLLTNLGKYSYNGLQVELRRRFTHGLYFQANYTFQKTLTNSPGTDQRRQEFELDATRPEIEFGRAQYDQTHVFNMNGIYELPFGKGRKFFSNVNGIVDRILGGWQVNGIVRIASGAPFGIFDPRGTLNYNTQSTRNTASTNLSKAEIKKLIGIFKTPTGVYFINPSVIDPVTGRAANGYGQPRFAGQVFFNVEPGQLGNMERFFLNGPTYINVDASLFKNIRITETTRVQIRAEAFNLFNRANFGISAAQQLQNVNSATFGRLSTTFDPRILQFAARFEF